HVGAGRAGGDGQVPVGVAVEPPADLPVVGGGIEVAVRGGGGFPAGLAGEDGPALLGAAQGQVQDGVLHPGAPGVAGSRVAVAGSAVLVVGGRAAAVGHAPAS